MSIEYDVVENKMTVPTSFTCRPVPIKVLGYDEIASIISAKNPSVTPNLVKCVLQQLSWITEKELLAGNTITLTNFVSIYLSIQSKLRHPDEPIPKDGLDIIGDPASQFVKDVSDLATFTRRGFVQKAPKIESEIDSNSGIPNWIRPGHAMTLTGSNLKFSPLRGDEGVFLTSPAGNTYLLDVPLFLSDKKVITMPIIDSEEGPAGKASVAYDLTLSARFASSGEVKTGSFLGRIRATNVIDQTNDLVFVSGSSATAPAKILTYTGSAMTARLIAWLKPNNTLMMEACSLTGSLTQAITISGNGVYLVPGLDGFSVEVTDFNLLYNTVIAYQRYLQEVIELNPSTGPVTFAFIICDWDAPNINTTPIKYPSYNAFAPVLPDNLVVLFSQGQSQEDKFESIVCGVSVDTSDPNYPYTMTSPGTFQQWNDPGVLGGQRFEDSSFIWAGGNRIYGRYGKNGNTLAWLVDPQTKSMTEINLGSSVYPVGYTRPLNCQRAAAVYVPSVDKVAMLYQQDSGDYDMYVFSAKITDSGSIPDNISANPIWEQGTEYVNIESYIAAGPFGSAGHLAYVADLYNNSTYTCKVFIVDIAGGTPLIPFTTSFVDNNIGHIVPVCIAGNPSANEFVLFFSDTNGNVYAIKFNELGSTVGDKIAIATGIGNDSVRGKAVWKTGSDEIIFMFGSDNDGILREFIITSSVSGFTLSTENSYSNEYASSFCDIGESSGILISTNLRKQQGLQPNVMRVRGIDYVQQ